MRFVFVFLATLALLAAAYGTGALLLDRFVAGRAPMGSELRNKMFLFRSFQAVAPVEVLIVGSSRCMKIDPEAIRHETGLRTFNQCLSGGQAEDYLAAFRWSVSQPGVRLKLLLVSLDPDTLGDAEPRYDSLRTDWVWNRLIGSDGPSRRALWDDLLALKASFSADWLVGRIRALKQASPEEARSIPDFEPNGYIHYTKLEHLKALGSFDRKQERRDIPGKWEEKYRILAKPSSQGDWRRKRCIEIMLKEARARGIRVILWLPPVAPELLTRLRRTTQFDRIQAGVATYIGGLCHSPAADVECFDFTDLDRFDGLNDDWYDTVHMGERNAERLARALFHGEPGQ